MVDRYTGPDSVGFDDVRDYPGAHNRIPTHAALGLMRTTGKSRTEKGGQQSPYHEYEDFLDICPESVAFKLISGLVGEELIETIASEDAEDPWKTTLGKLITITADRLIDPKREAAFHMAPDDLVFIESLASHVFSTMTEPIAASALLDSILTAEVSPRLGLSA